MDNEDIEDGPIYATISKKYADKKRKQVSAESGLGDPSKGVGNTLHGINFLGHSLGVKTNTDYQGLTLFTRPYLNFTPDNISSKRRLTPYLTDKEETLHHAIKLLLDTKQSINYNGDHPLTDNRMGFIPAFTNLLTSLTGWPDETLDLYISTPGIRNEVYAQADHLGTSLNTFDLTATFRNIEGDPINAILAPWLVYIKGVADGSMVPYYEMIASKSLDYQSRVYRLVLDSGRQWIQKIACCGACVPTANPIGSSFSYTENKPTIEETNEQAVPFTCVGYLYNDPIIARNFNATVMYYNRSMTNANRSTSMVKVPLDALYMFNFKAYPLITQDMELQWYVPRETYTLTLEAYGLPSDIVPEQINDVIDADTNRGILPWEKPPKKL